MKQIKGVEKAYLGLTEENIDAYQTFKHRVKRMSAQVRLARELA